MGLAGLVVPSDDGDLLAGRTPPLEALENTLDRGVGPNLFSPVDLYCFTPSWLVGTGAQAGTSKWPCFWLPMPWEATSWASGWPDRWAALWPEPDGLQSDGLGLIESGALRDALWVFPALFVASLFSVENPDEPPRSWLASVTLAGSFLTTWLQGILALVALCLLVCSVPHLRSHLGSRLLGLVPGLLVAAFFHAPLLAAILDGAYPFSGPSLAGLDSHMSGGHRILHQSSLPLDFLALPQHPQGLNPLLLLLLVLPWLGNTGLVSRGPGGTAPGRGPYLRWGPEGHPLQIGEPGSPALPSAVSLAAGDLGQSPVWFAPLLYLGLAGLGAQNLMALKTSFEEHAFLVPLVVLVVLSVTTLDAGHREPAPRSCPPRAALPYRLPGSPRGRRSGHPGPGTASSWISIRLQPAWWSWLEQRTARPCRA